MKWNGTMFLWLTSFKSCSVYPSPRQTLKNEESGRTHKGAAAWSQDTFYPSFIKEVYGPWAAVFCDRLISCAS